MQEHHVVDLLISELRDLQPDDDEFAPKMTVLIENVEHHAEEEESELFPKLREAFGQERLQRIGERWHRPSSGTSWTPSPSKSYTNRHVSRAYRAARA